MNRTHLIRALRAAAYKAETQPEAYQWFFSNKCNVGLVVQELLCVDENQLLLLIADMNMPGTWSARVDKVRARPRGQPMPDLFARLEEAGLEIYSIRHLEWMLEPRIRDRAGMTADTRMTEYRQDFIVYARAWANILEEHDLVEASGVAAPVLN